jgi:hypothetical protein
LRLFAHLWPAGRLPLKGGTSLAAEAANLPP